MRVSGADYGYPLTVTSGANASANITLPARGIGYRISFIETSYNGAPTGGGLTITFGGTTVFSTDITSAGAGPREVEIKTPADQAVVITILAAGAGVVGKLNVIVV